MKFIIITLVVILVAYIIQQYYRIDDLRSNASLLVEQAVPYQQSPVNPTKRILIIGDSLQAGVGASDPKYSMAGLLGTQFPEWAITNLAVSGFETKDALHKLLPLSIGGFDLAIVQIGANDIFHLTKLAAAKDSLQLLLDSAQARADMVLYVTSGSIGYAPLFPGIVDWFYTQRSRKFISEFIQVANQAEVAVLDNYRDRQDDLFEQNPDLYYAIDGFHLSDAGYQVWHERLVNKLAEIDFIE